MQLTVPNRTVADTGSFPVNPEGVALWLSNLRPLDSETDAREVYRGLKHSNRLHNDVNQRRSVISCFVPVLRKLHVHLSELSNAQPLPLTREFARNARLRDSLLREEAFAFKILLSDSDSPLADDARRAMQALSRQAEAVVHTYRAFPDALIEDAHQLYALAEEHKLLSAEHGTELLTLQDHYRFIMLISVADLSQQRARQLPLVLNFLRDSVADIHIERKRSPESISANDYAINLKQGSRPEPARSLLSAEHDDVRWFSVAPVLYGIEKTSARISASTMSILGSDTLERQSLARLQVALLRSRQRRLSRIITRHEQRVVLGHKEICAHLLYRSQQGISHSESDWVVINQTQYGMCLCNDACRAGLVQVGELVSITDPATTPSNGSNINSGKVDALMGVVRWIRASDEAQLKVGVEFLARTVMPVFVTRSPGISVAEKMQSVDVSDRTVVRENALIIACKVKNVVLQTILLPSYLYQVGDKLVAAQGSKSRNVTLHKCLQSNGLFTQYSVIDSR